MVLTFPFDGHELYNEQRAFRDMALDRALTLESFHARAREVMLRHPAEPYFPFVGAVRATVTRDESVLPWAGRALERSPVYGRVQVTAVPNSQDEFTTETTFTYARTGQQVKRSGRSVIYTGFQWRGRSTTGTNDPSPYREVMFLHCTQCNAKYEMTRAEMTPVVTSTQAFTI